MFLRRFLGLLDQVPRSTSGSRRLAGSRLRLESLEHRILLSVSPHDAPASAAAANAPTQYLVVVPEQANVGTKEQIEVIALDAAGHPAFGYNGTASLTEIGATTSALPTSVSFHHGFDSFDATFSGTGGATLTATETDTVNATPITDSGTTTVNGATAATQLVVYMPAHETPGKPVNVTVEALDAAGHVVPTYTGAVSLTTAPDTASTFNATFPYTFTASDAGKHTFQVTFSTATGSGQQTVTATDGDGLTGSVSTNLASPSAVTHFGVSTAENSQEGEPTSVSVVALNANNQPVRNYTGTVSFAPVETSTTTSETLPASYTFTTGRGWRADDGQHTFEVTYNATGAQSFGVSDANGISSPTVTTNVFATTTATSLLVITPENIPTNKTVPVAVVALDAANHPVKSFTDTVTLSASPSSGATITGPVTPNNKVQGIERFEVTFTTTGAETLTATDTSASPNLTGTATTTVTTPPPGHRWGFGGRF